MHISRNSSFIIGTNISMKLRKEIEKGLQLVTPENVDSFVKNYSHPIFALINGKVESTRFQILKGTKIYIKDNGVRIMGHHLKDMVNLGK